MKPILVAAIMLVASLLSGCDTHHDTMMGYGTTPTSFESNGERIYFTGVSSSGQAVTYTGGNIHLQMMGGGCATCHGTDRAGRRMMPELWAVAPALTRVALFEKHDDGGAHGGHEAYDDASLRRAISHGLDAEGEPLDPIMPKWSMSDEDWRDLIAFLRR